MVLSTGRNSWWKKKLKTDGCGSQEAAVGKHGTEYITSPGLFSDISECLNMHTHIFLSLQPCNLLSPHFLVHPNHTVAFFASLEFSSSLFPLHLPFFKTSTADSMPCSVPSPSCSLASFVSFQQFCLYHADLPSTAQCYKAFPSSSRGTTL